MCDSFSNVVIVVGCCILLSAAYASGMMRRWCVTDSADGEAYKKSSGSRGASRSR